MVVHGASTDLNPVKKKQIPPEGQAPADENAPQPCRGVSIFSEAGNAAIECQMHV
jgi:hypothetical protein